MKTALKHVAAAMLAAAAAAIGTALGEVARDAIKKKWGAPDDENTKKTRKKGKK